MTHGFRLLHAGNLADRQVDFEAIAKAIGTSEETVAQHYAHHFRKDAAGFSARIDRPSRKVSRMGSSLTAAIQRYVDSGGRLPPSKPIDGTQTTSTESDPDQA